MEDSAAMRQCSTDEEDGAVACRSPADEACGTATCLGICLGYAAAMRQGSVDVECGAGERHITADE